MSEWTASPADAQTLREVFRCIDQTDEVGLRTLASSLREDLERSGFCGPEDLGHWFAGGNRPHLDGPIDRLGSYLLYKALVLSVESAKDPTLVDRPGDAFEVLRRHDLRPWGRPALCSSVGLSADLYRNSQASPLRALEAHRAFWLDPASRPDERHDAVAAFRRSWGELREGTLLAFLIDESCLSLAFRSTSILTCRETDGGVSMRGAVGYADYARAFLGVHGLQISWLFSPYRLQATLSPQPF